MYTNFNITIGENYYEELLMHNSHYVAFLDQDNELHTDLENNRGLCRLKLIIAYLH